ncbi:alpha/beta hydrolase [Desertibaculum subflavum]|uniref:alpha/beta hydrolase n=1 Tax=Desertibaculum subflavum TaxID=2268458 RepID=UPI0013C3E7CB
MIGVLAALGFAANLIGAFLVYAATHVAPPAPWGPQHWLPPKTANHTTPAAFGFAYETLRVPGAVGVLELWHLPLPSARGLAVMFHGHAAMKSALLEEARALRALGLAVLLADFRASGGSDGEVTTIGWREADDVLRVLDTAATIAAGRPLVLFGTSMGAVAILRAATLRPLPAAAAILEVPFDTLEHAVANRFRALGMPAYPATWAVLLYGGLFVGLDPFAFRPVDFARSFDLPTLVIKGGADPTVTEDEIRNVVAALPGPKQLTLLPKAGHFGLLRADRAGWTSAVAGFLDAHLPTPPR